MKYFVRLIAVCAASILSVHGQSTSHVSQARELPQVVWKPDFTISNANTNATCLMACSRDGKLLAAGSDKTIRIYEVQGEGRLSERLTRTLTCDSPIQAMTFRGSNLLVSLSAGRSVKTWDTVSGRMLHNLSLNFEKCNV